MNGASALHSRRTASQSRQTRTEKKSRTRIATNVRRLLQANRAKPVLAPSASGMRCSAALREPHQRHGAEGDSHNKAQQATNLMKCYVCFKYPAGLHTCLCRVRGDTQGRTLAEQQVQYSSRRCAVCRTAHCKFCASRVTSLARSAFAHAYARRRGGRGFVLLWATSRKPIRRVATVCFGIPGTLLLRTLLSQRSQWATAWERGPGAEHMRTHHMSCALSELVQPLSANMDST